MNEDERRAGLAETASYRYADVVDNQLFVAGQVPHDAEGNIVGEGDPARQAVQCLENLATVLTVNGFEVGEVRHLTVYVVGPHQNLLDGWTAVAQWFDQTVPPATLLGVNLLGYRDQLIEVDATVVRQTN
ncbi:MAG: RidA family protein [Acidimicrobiales bacterium]